MKGKAGNKADLKRRDSNGKYKEGSGGNLFLIAIHAQWNVCGNFACAQLSRDVFSSPLCHPQRDRCLTWRRQQERSHEEQRMKLIMMTPRLSWGIQKVIMEKTPPLRKGQSVGTDNFHSNTSSLFDLPSSSGRLPSRRMSACLFWSLSFGELRLRSIH